MARQSIAMTRLGVLICQESAIPGLARRLRRAGTDVLASNFGGSEVFDPPGGRRRGLSPGMTGVAMAELGRPIGPAPYVRLGDWPTAAAAVALLAPAAWWLRSRRGAG